MLEQCESGLGCRRLVGACLHLQGRIGLGEELFGLFMLTVPDAHGRRRELGPWMDKQEDEQETVNVSASQPIPHVANTQIKDKYPY